MWTYDFFSAIEKLPLTPKNRAGAWRYAGYKIVLLLVKFLINPVKPFNVSKMHLLFRLYRWSLKRGPKLKPAHKNTFHYVFCLHFREIFLIVHFNLALWSVKVKSVILIKRNKEKKNSQPINKVMPTNKKILDLPFFY